MGILPFLAYFGFHGRPIKTKSATQYISALTAATPVRTGYFDDRFYFIWLLGWFLLEHLLYLLICNRLCVNFNTVVDIRDCIVDALNYIPLY